VNPISITVTGRLGDDPRPFTTHTGTPGVELRLALEVPSCTPGADSVTRWVKVIAFGPLAERTAASVGKSDRVLAGESGSQLPGQHSRGGHLDRHYP
jgi:single-stranded DNA-binding protein